MKYIIISILVLFSLSAYSQIEDTPLFVGKYFGNQSGGGSGYWQVTGNFTDESGYYDATSIQVGDVLFFVDAGIGYHLPVTTIVSASGSSFTIRVNNTGISGVAGVPNGPGGIYRANSPKGIWPFTAGLTASDQQTLNSFLIKRLNNEPVKRDTFITVPHSTNYIPNLVIATPSRFYNNIYISCKGISDTSTVAFLAAPTSDHYGVVYNIKNDSGLVETRVLSDAHLSNTKTSYLLRPGQMAQVRALKDQRQAGAYKWAVNLLWDSTVVSGSGGVTSSVLADTAAAIRADFQNGIISALPLGDVSINTTGNSLVLKNTNDSIVTNASSEKLLDIIGRYDSDPTWNSNLTYYDYGYLYTRTVGSTFDATGRIAIERARGTLASPTTVNTQDRVGEFNFRARGSSSFRNVASIIGEVDSVSGNSVQGVLKFGVAKDGEPYLTANQPLWIERLKIKAWQPIIISTDSRTRTGEWSFRVNDHFNVRQNGKVYIGADSSFLHAPAQDTTLLKGSARVINTNSQVRLSKSEYTDVFGSNLETGLDVSSRYNASWVSRFVVNPYGYVDLVNVENNGDNPRFNFYNSRGTSESTKARSQPNDYVGFVGFGAYNGTAYHRGAVIGTSIAANSASGSTRFSQTMFFGIDKANNSPQISSNWLLALDTIRAYVPKNFQVGGLINGTTANLFVNSLVNGNVGVNTVSPTSKFQVAGSMALSVTTISSATTLGEHAIVFATGASTYLVTLPTASTCTGRRYIIKVNGGAKTISSYLDLTGSASTTLTNNTVLTIVSDGTNWQQIQ